jgi:hypothetical protein
MLGTLFRPYQWVMDVNTNVNAVQSTVNNINSNVGQVAKSPRPILYASTAISNNGFLLPVMASAGAINAGRNEFAVVYPYSYSPTFPLVTSIGGKGRILAINTGGREGDAVLIVVDGINMQMPGGSGGVFGMSFTSGFSIYNGDRYNPPAVQVLYELY